MSEQAYSSLHWFQSSYALVEKTDLLAYSEYNCGFMVYVNKLAVVSGPQELHPKNDALKWRL